MRKPRCKTSSKKLSDRKHEREKGDKPRNRKRIALEKRTKKNFHELSNSSAVSVQPLLLKKCQMSQKRVGMT